MSEARTALEDKVVEAARAAGDEVVALVTELVACDTTARARLATRRGTRRSCSSCWPRASQRLGARTSTSGSRRPPAPAVPLDPGRPRLRGPAPAGRPSLAGARRRTVSSLLNGHIDAVGRGAASRAGSSDPFKADDARRLPVRPRRQRHEGRHRLTSSFALETLRRLERAAGRRRDVLHEHRRGVVRRRRSPALVARGVRGGRRASPPSPPASTPGSPAAARSTP